MRYTNGNRMSADKLDLRWDQFLIKARERFEEILAESVADCRALGDPQVVIRAWTAMRIRAHGLRAKVEQVWTSQVREQYEAQHAWSRGESAWSRGQALRDWMEIEIHRAETGLLAGVVRQLLAEVEDEHATTCCSECAAPLQVGRVLQARDHACPRCGRLNRVEPGPRACQVVELGPHLWREACWDLWVAKHQAELLVRRSEELTLAQLKAWEQAEIDYLCAWLRERTKLLPDAGIGGEAELRRRLDQFYRSLDREAVWTRAGSPRDLA